MENIAIEQVRDNDDLKLVRGSSWWRAGRE